MYDATGAKLQKITDNNGTITVQHYINGVEYNGTTLERIPHTEGGIVQNSAGDYVYEYTLKDHLGNTRVTFGDADNDGIVQNTDVKQINHFFPFGLNMEGPGFGMVHNNKYEYNQKELNTDFGLNWNDYGARFYDAAIARWAAVDPLGEKFFNHNPYNYVMGRPTIMVDPTGMSAEFDAKTGELKKAEGEDARNYVRGQQAAAGIKYSSTQNKDGSYTTFLDVTIKLVNVSSDKGKDLNTLGSNIQDKAAQTFKGGASWTFNNGTKNAVNKQIRLITTFHIIPVSTISAVGNNNLAIAIVDKVTQRDKDGGEGIAEIGGFFGAVGKYEGVGTYVHEIGHLLGLEDRYGKGNSGVGIMFDSKSYFIQQQDVFFILSSFLGPERLGKSGSTNNWGRRGEPSLQKFIDNNTN